MSSSNFSTMALSSDLREFIALLNSSDVEYLVVGAHSLAFHARPRFTGDLDLLIRPTLGNADKLITVLNVFGFADLGLSASDFIESEQIIQLGRAPHRIDLLTSISGVSTEEAFSKRIPAELADLPVNFLSKDLLIANKRAVARPQDIADLEALEN